jgi:CO/xanthine dehydrogenase FAD-binding subunit
MRPVYFEDLEGFLELGSLKIEYLEPNTLKEACSLLAQYKEKAKLISGVHN